jgi:excisionase family DNA binding protein
MTEGMTEGDNRAPKRYTVPEAARVLGIGTDAVRKRISRGTIRHEREGGRVFIYLDVGHDTGHDDEQASQDLRDPGSHELHNLVAAQREEISYLRGVIATRDEELRTRSEELRRRDLDLERRDHIIASLTERIPPAIEPPRSEAPSSEAEDAPQSPPSPGLTPTPAPTGAEREMATEMPMGPTPSEASEATQEGSEPRRSWWREFFGFN